MLSAANPTRWWRSLSPTNCRGGGVDLVRRIREAGFEGRIFAHGPVVSDGDVAEYRDLKVESVVVTQSGPDELLGVVEAWCDSGSDD